MSAPDLPKHLIPAGKELLDALDRAGLAAQGAAWVFFHELEDWRFVVATSLVETMGRSKVYKMLLIVMEQIDMPDDLTIEDIHLISTESLLYRAVSGAFRVEGSGTVRIANCRIDGALIDAVIFRWGAGPLSAGEMKRVEKEFRRRVKELAG